MSGLVSTCFYANLSASECIPESKHLQNTFFVPFSLQSRYAAAGDKTPCRKSSSQSPAQNQTVPLQINFAQVLSVIISHQCVPLTLASRWGKHEKCYLNTMTNYVYTEILTSFQWHMLYESFSGAASSGIPASKVHNYNYVGTKLVTVCSNAVEIIVIMCT